MEEEDETQVQEGKVTSHSVVKQKSTKVQAHVTSFSSSTTQKSSSSFSSMKRSLQSLLNEGDDSREVLQKDLLKSQLNFSTQSSQSSQKSSASENVSRSSSQTVCRGTSQTDEERGEIIPTCQIITHQASNESEESTETISETDANGKKITKVYYEGSAGGQNKSGYQKETGGVVSTSRFSDHRFSAKLGLFSRSGTSSSSQEEYEPEIKLFGQKTVSSSGQYLTAGRVETAKSMESLRIAKESSSNTLSVNSEKTLHSHRGSFLTTSERDVRKVMTAGTENKSFESYDRDMRLKRRALSGEEMGGSLSVEDGQITAERRRGLFAGVERRLTPQHLSLPPTGGPFFGMGTSHDSARKLMILSPHSPHTTPDLLNFCQPMLSIKGRRKKGMVLPKLILPRSDSEASEVFFDHRFLE